MNKEMSKAIMKRSSLKNKYLKNGSYINRQKYKLQRNLCVSLKRKAIKEDFQNVTHNLKGGSNPFYDLIKPYLTSKGALCSSDIILLENKRLISTESELVDIFNEYYINIVKYSSGKTPIDITTSLNPRTKVKKLELV